MNIPLFFNGHSEYALPEYLSYGGIAKEAGFHHSQQVPNWQQADVAIFSVKEYRGSQDKPSADYTDGDEVRKAFYKLKPLSKDCKMVDLGELRPGHHLEETHLRLAEVCEALLSHNTLPLIIGGSHDLDYGQFMAYQNMDKLISVLQVDAALDLNPVPRISRDIPEEEGKPRVTEGNHLRQILMHHPNYLFDCNHLGYQRYLNDAGDIHTLKALAFDVQSVGEARAALPETEPIIRMADMMSLDLAAVRKAEAPAQSQPSVFGFTGEEACQVCWYAGMSEKLSSLGLYGYRQDLDKDHSTAMTVAVMMWYFLEGVAHRQQEFNFNSNFHIKYFVQTTDGPSLTFYKSKITERWWMEIGTSTLGQPPSTYTPHIERPLIIPCSYADYQKANSGEIPERWIRAQARPEG